MSEKAYVLHALVNLLLYVVTIILGGEDAFEHYSHLAEHLMVIYFTALVCDVIHNKIR